MYLFGQFKITLFLTIFVDIVSVIHTTDAIGHPYVHNALIDHGIAERVIQQAELVYKDDESGFIYISNDHCK